MKIIEYKKETLRELSFNSLEELWNQKKPFCLFDDTDEETEDDDEKKVIYLPTETHDHYYRYFMSNKGLNKVNFIDLLLRIST